MEEIELHYDLTDEERDTLLKSLCSVRFFNI